MPISLQWRRYRLPLAVPLRTAHGLWREREGVLLRVEDGEGAARFGEISPVPWFGTETVDEAAAVCGALGEIITGDPVEHVPERYGCVRFALAAACAPRKAEQVGRLAVAALLPAGRAALEALRLRLEAGFLAFKWKVGVGDPADELSLLDDILAALPPHARLRLDANGAWTRRQAAQWLDRCAEYPVEFVEQPVAFDDVDSLLGLARDYPVTLALDESVTGLEQARRWQGLGWTGVYVLKPALAGPPALLEEWIAQAQADVVISSAIETVVGRNAVLRWALGAPRIRRALGFGVGAMFGDRRWDGPAIGPLADASCIASAGMEEDAWNALA